MESLLWVIDIAAMVVLVAWSARNEKLQAAKRQQQ